MDEAANFPGSFNYMSSKALQLTVKTLTDAPNLKAMFELEPVRNNAIKNYIQTRGSSLEEASMYYEREKILFFKAMQQNKELEKCDRFSIYSCWIELAASGLTLNDGFAYIIPYGKQAQFQPGWKGRLDQMNDIPEIENIPPPQVVYENDEFDYELGDHPRIIKHKPTKGERGPLAFVYLVIQKKSGKELHLMSRAEVLSIRDRWAKPYIKYAKACADTGTAIGKPVKISGQFGDYFLDPPMWVSDEAEAWKKTLVKRAWKSQSNKTARMKALDKKTENNFDPEDNTGGEQTNDIDYGLVDTSTGEIKEGSTQNDIKQQLQQQESNLGDLSASF